MKTQIAITTIIPPLGCFVNSSSYVTLLNVADPHYFVLGPFHFSWCTLSPMGMLSIDLASFPHVCWELTTGRTSLWAPHLYTHLPLGGPLAISQTPGVSTCPQGSFPFSPSSPNLSLSPEFHISEVVPFSLPKQKPGRFLDPPHLGINLKTSTDLSSSSLILLPHCFWSSLSTSIEFLISVRILCFLFDSFKKWDPHFC